LILRTSWVYAARGHNFARTILKLAEEREVLYIVSDQVGAPTWARSIASATTLLLANLQLYPAANKRRDSRFAAQKEELESAEEAVWGVYHLTADGATSWHGFAAALLEGLAQRLPANPRIKAVRLEAIPTTAYPLPAARPANSRLNCDKLAASFGLRLPHWRKGVDLCLADIVDRCLKW
jgi:dTDP-4-dehydrorhamnose reductase